MRSWPLRPVWTTGGPKRGHFVVFGAAVAVAAIAGLVLVAVTEDVMTHDGLVEHDWMGLMVFVDHRPAWLVNTAAAATWFGSALGVCFVAVAAGGYLWRQGQRLAVAITPAAVVAIAGAAAGAAKALVNRSRPPVQLRLVRVTASAFPSGHATASSALFLTVAMIVAVLVLHRWSARLVALVCAVAAAGSVGISRLVLGVHWRSDIVGGWALGTIMAMGMGTVACAAAWRPDRPHDSRPARLLRARRSSHHSRPPARTSPPSKPTTDPSAVA